MTDGTSPESGSPKLNPDITRGLSRSQQMALARTLMANRRTVLSYVRTASGCWRSATGWSRSRHTRSSKPPAWALGPAHMPSGDGVLDPVGIRKEST